MAKRGDREAAEIVDAAIKWRKARIEAVKDASNFDDLADAEAELTACVRDYIEATGAP